MVKNILVLYIDIYFILFKKAKTLFSTAAAAADTAVFYIIFFIFLVFHDCSILAAVTPIQTI